jgi:hypothetical protein
MAPAAPISTGTGTIRRLLAQPMARWMLSYTPAFGQNRPVGGKLQGRTEFYLTVVESESSAVSNRRNWSIRLLRIRNAAHRCTREAHLRRHRGRLVLQLDGSAPIFSPRSTKLFIVSFAKVPNAGGDQSSGIEATRTSTSASRLSLAISAIA